MFDIKCRASGYVLPLISILITLCTLAYAMLLGASLYETVTVLMLFAAVNLLSFGSKGGNA
ncbi:MAG: hypothetical protein J6A24_04345 [Clostridia bacterium]|nr:hypothetical protein [Clostridia bacterium]